MAKQPKGNIIQEWDNGYESIKTTYEDKVIDDRATFILNMLYELVYETILSKIDASKSFKTLECGCVGGQSIRLSIQERCQYYLY